MTLAELIAAYRIDANDKVLPYFASDEVVTDWLNEAEAEAAIRGRLLHESADPAVCRVAVEAGRSVYPLPLSLYELTHHRLRYPGRERDCLLYLVTTEHLDGFMPDWRERQGEPQYLIQDDTSLRLVPEPQHECVLILEGYRLPMAPMLLAEKDTASPEINSTHHRHLVQWALHRGFSIPDADSFDPGRANTAAQAFARYFGLSPGADLRRATREDTPQHVEAFWP